MYASIRMTTLFEAWMDGQRDPSLECDMKAASSDLKSINIQYLWWKVKLTSLRMDLGGKVVAVDQRHPRMCTASEECLPRNFEVQVAAANFVPRLWHLHAHQGEGTCIIFLLIWIHITHTIDREVRNSRCFPVSYSRVFHEHLGRHLGLDRPGVSVFAWICHLHADSSLLGCGTHSLLHTDHHSGCWGKSTALRSLQAIYTTVEKMSSISMVVLLYILDAWKFYTGRLTLRRLSRILIHFNLNSSTLNQLELTNKISYFILWSLEWPALLRLVLYLLEQFMLNSRQPKIHHVVCNPNTCIAVG